AYRSKQSQFSAAGERGSLSEAMGNGWPGSGSSRCKNTLVWKLMPFFNDPTRPSISPSPRGASEDNPDDRSEQLSEPDGVDMDVSSLAMDRGLLAIGGVSPQPAAETSLPGSAVGLTDADVMLRVKVGDEPAFEYLVQKYRRAMVSFMYRMTHNSAAAE